MKKTIPVFTTIAVMMIMACNSNPATKETPVEEHTNVVAPVPDTATATDPAATPAVDTSIKVIAATFSSVDPGVTSFMGALVQHYLELKNALFNADEKVAAAASAKMETAMKSFDKSLLSTDQKKVYDGVEADLKEHTEHIAKSKLAHQREHFAMMSEDMADLVKAFGAGRPLYLDNCPMYKKGSNWLSEVKEIRNPFYGSEMPGCGDVTVMYK
ncbi:DUF3347 domain-containing protein [Flavihumibacter profundi]|uniref:DUF3347 domain-containing protein n=1 Tax=Flavihumibacter profundi TaxID=2716883 RepID=UPI001CC44278|nr:DUF3347 domain-containing protein [Flavihumibacter profundi]MBZ5858390.1 DUF3347 domain-containing protein [Flavihumibacter profundi]